MQEKKQEKAARTIYISLAVVIAAVMIVSVVAAVNRRRNRIKTPEVTDGITTERRIPDPPETKAPGKKPPVTTSPITVPPDNGETTVPEPSAPTEPVVDITVPEEETPVVVERIYVIPVNGDIIKDYTMDLQVYSLTMNDYRTHNGVDIAAENGTPVCAFTDGTVEKVYNDPMMGSTVLIDHGNGMKSLYQNLQSVPPEGIEKGRAVNAGDIIGAVGDTALIECAEVSHLHFAVTEGGVCIAPSSYLGSLINEAEE